MTREEAIKFLNSGCLMLACEYHIGNNRCDDDYNVKEERMNEALNMAIADMEKQIPRKIANYRKTENAIYGNCLICGRRVIKDNYCPKCGTALDWSD